MPTLFLPFRHLVHPDRLLHTRGTMGMAEVITITIDTLTHFSSRNNITSKTKIKMPIHATLTNNNKIIITSNPSSISNIPIIRTKYLSQPRQQDMQLPDTETVFLIGKTVGAPQQTPLSVPPWRVNN